MSSGTDPSATQRYEHMQYRRCGASGLRCPPCRWAPGRPTAGRATATSPRRCITARSTSASPTSTSPTTTATRPATPKLICGEIVRQLPRDEIVVVHQGRLPDVARAATATGARASTSSPAATSRCAGWASTTSTSSTPTAPIRRRRSRRRWARSTTLVDHGKALYVGVSSYTGDAVRRGGHRRRAASACRSPSTSRTTTCSVARSRSDLLPRIERPAPASSRSARWRRGCSPTSTSTARCPAGSRGTMWPGRWVRAHDVDARRTILRASTASQGARPVAGADGDRVDPARSPDHRRGRRRPRVEQIRANVRGPRQPRVQRRRARAIDALTSAPAADAART